jgi:hypothetical protein
MLPTFKWVRNFSQAFFVNSLSVSGVWKAGAAMETGYTHTGLWHAAARISLVLSLLLAFPAGPGRAGEAEPLQAESDSDQYDMYYDAMLRSIELDKNRWKSFSRSMESGPWFYDTQGLKRDSSKVTVPVTVYPHPNKTELYRSVYPEHAKIRKIVFATEIDCSKLTYRQPQIHVYGYYGELLIEHAPVTKDQGFSPIKAGSTTDTLRTLVCNPDRKKRR